MFIDGVGLGDEAEYNPWVTEPTPHLRGCLSGFPLSRRAVGTHGEVRLVATDACLGVEGLPQSATGQATIFTGRNASQAMDMHMAGLPFRRLRNWVQEDNIYKQFAQKGWKATFANCYTKEYFERPATKRGWISVTTAAIQSVPEPVRFLPDLLRGEAVYHDLTRRTLKMHSPEVEEITPELAAEHLIRLGESYDLVVHEFFLSDRAGHKHDPELVRWVIETLDRFVGAMIRLREKEDTIVIVSDHGNMEDLRVRTHTMNPVPTMVIGDIGAIGEERVAQWNLCCIAPLLGRLVERRKKGED
ncbi:alkaline phosphatase family protein [Laceyella putida]|uniref:Alkaline phosphatase family protein n=1 Tax=Laceyella putida TaxID=110101 RepID=A0ABW2RG01_9BACL